MQWSKEKRRREYQMLLPYLPHNVDQFKTSINFMPHCQQRKLHQNKLKMKITLKGLKLK